MKLNKNKIFNLLLLVVIGLMFFPPADSKWNLKVHLNRLFSFSPSVEKFEDRKVLSDYQWSLMSLDGQKYSFEKTKDKVVLVNLWATWCPPCVAEMPSFQKLYNDYKDRVAFLFVTNEDPEKARTFLEKNAYDLPVYIALEKGPEQIHSTSIPASYLIGKNAKIVIDEKGAADWNSDKLRAIIDQLLEE
ncbi:TlpA disulfide reductase family protein [Galbibacter sp. EGI 63066]|uniref:TlpA family protein disulfide reductase n=1 Tax=Galbibacter sp. EGI 63066 TaxID=2993559 RepID=UPI0022487C11|nr:TlpA disulfide reductase family protein [Galbibacter sp. EGI 63066]MCX2679615.1 TlpA disulfide reductase family protein [Galbibacter sp. EGI 63066]